VNTSERNKSAAIFGATATNTACPEVAALVQAAQRDLAHVVDLLAEESDCLVALVLLARAAKNTDEAVFALLDGHAANARKDPYNIPTMGMLDFIATKGVPDD
jgi:hypothetical protein